MAFYSFTVIAKHPVGIPRPLVLLDTGLNIFNVEIPNLEDFKAFLENEEVTIQTVNCLDEHEAGSPGDLFLEGAEGELLLGDVSV